MVCCSAPCRGSKQHAQGPAGGGAGSRAQGCGALWGQRAGGLRPPQVLFSSANTPYALSSLWELSLLPSSLPSHLQLYSSG